MTKQKKPKVGDTVGWVVITSIGGIVSWHPTRAKARDKTLRYNYSDNSENKIAKIVISK